MAMKQFKPTRFGKYQLLDRIAVGGMAELFRARITGVQGFEKLIVIKRILPNLAADDKLVGAFIHEAKLAARLQHENIVQIYDFGQMDGAYFIAMEFLFGKDLRAVFNRAIHKKKPVNLDLALYIVSRICAGLAYAHQFADISGRPLNIIHRDITPQNILLTYTGQIKIIDFGIAKAATHDNATQVGTIKGKLAYMSPEQACGKTIDHRSDIFSTGVILYELALRHRMYEGETFEILTKAQKAQYINPAQLNPRLPPALMAIFDKALAVRPDQRYNSAAAMQVDLEKLLHQQGPHPRTRIMGDYLRELFERETAVEELTLREALQAGVDEDADINNTQFEDTLVLKPKEKIQPGRFRKWLWSGLGALVVVGLLFWWGWFPNSDHIKEVAQSAQSALVEEDGERALQLFDEVLDHLRVVPEAQRHQYAELMTRYAEARITTQPLTAMAFLVRAVRFAPQNADIFHKLGFAHQQMDQMDKAVDAYRNALDRNVHHTKAWYNLGLIQRRMGQLDDARKAFEQAIAQNPPFLNDVRYNLALVHYEMGDAEAALDLGKQILLADPGHAYTRQLIDRLHREEKLQ